MCTAPCLHTLISNDGSIGTHTINGIEQDPAPTTRGYAVAVTAGPTSRALGGINCKERKGGRRQPQHLLSIGDGA